VATTIASLACPDRVTAAVAACNPACQDSFSQLTPTPTLMDPPEKKSCDMIIKIPQIQIAILLSLATVAPKIEAKGTYWLQVSRCQQTILKNRK
jgi:hypothetical protein